LPGKPSWAFRRVEGFQEMGRTHEVHPERWIEVWPGDDCIDIMTRQSDKFTNSIARGIALTLALFYRREPYFSHPEFMLEENKYWKP